MTLNFFSPLLLRLITGLFLCLSMLSSVHAKSSESNILSPLGMNTNEAMEINASVPFVDLFRLSLPFEDARPWLTKGKIEYDYKGWPKRLNGGEAGTRFINAFPQQSIPSGEYTVLYKGEGKIKYAANAHIVRRQPGKDIIRFRGRGGKITATLSIIKSNPKNYIRDIQILMPGGICKNNPFRHIRKPKRCSSKNPYMSYAKQSKTIVFNPDYLAFMKSFRVVRFMNMSGITRNNIQKWSQRPKIDQATWGGNKEGKRGVPLEIMIKLANLVSADPWLNIPHRADNDFVREYARYVKQHLRPALKAYVEYTNEAWNGVFSQMHYVQNMGKHLGLDEHKANAGYKFFSKRSVEIFKIWEQEFRGNKRLVRVMGGMSTNVTLTHMVLGYEDAYKHTDALAIAPYFHAPQSDQAKITSVDQVFRLLLSPHNKYSIPNTLKIIRNQAKIAKSYGVDLIAYEGGQHLVAYKTHSMNEGPNRFLMQANRDDRMSKLYYEFLNAWKKSGGKLFVAFSAPRAYNWIGSWGIKEYITQAAADAPKYRALLFFQKHNRCWWLGCNRLGGYTRLDKPKFNPGLEVMELRFKPRFSEEKIKSSSTLALINNANKKRDMTIKKRKMELAKQKILLKKEKVARLKRLKVQKVLMRKEQLRVLRKARVRQAKVVRERRIRLAILKKEEKKALKRKQEEENRHRNPIYSW
ncbi:MAG: hypothetical protein KAG28_05530, partial [Cocleimonas sp.]|nr:hypothetical protein [Cocleimonas sp.]